jgi:hypothetical protein
VGYLKYGAKRQGQESRSFWCNVDADVDDFVAMYDEVEVVKVNEKRRASSKEQTFIHEEKKKGISAGLIGE